MTDNNSITVNSNATYLSFSDYSSHKIDEVPLRIDFAGGWLDVPKYSRKSGYVINCAIQPLVSLKTWTWNKQAGLGGSAAWSLLNGKDPITSELGLGVGWQDPAIIMATGLCIWRSGALPVLVEQQDPSWLEGKWWLYWTGESHDTPNLADRQRNYPLISIASIIGSEAVSKQNHAMLCKAVNMTYESQIEEGMRPLPFDCSAKKYCGGGHGGYALYSFVHFPPVEMIPVIPYYRPRI